MKLWFVCKIKHIC